MHTIALLLEKGVQISVEGGDAVSGVYAHVEWLEQNEDQFKLGDFS